MAQAAAIERVMRREEEGGDGRREGKNGKRRKTDEERRKTGREDEVREMQE